MADTVRDEVKVSGGKGDSWDEMPATIRDEDEMPATLRDEDEPMFNNPLNEKSSKLKPARSFFFGSVGQKP